jgi:thiamine biosynthesis protein ThiS
MIVEINHRFIHAEAYDRTMVTEGDRMEIIHLAMGG